MTRDWPGQFEAELARLGLEPRRARSLRDETVRQADEAGDDPRPLFGPPHGYGIGQLDLFSSPQRGANDDEVWNWVANLRAAAMVVLADKAVAAWKLVGQHVPAQLDHFTRAVFQRETVRRYNGGTEFAWTGATWAVRPSVQWVAPDDHGKGPSPNVLYPNLVLGTSLVYYTSASGRPNVPDGANTQFGYPPPMPFAPANYGPRTGP